MERELFDWDGWDGDAQCMIFYNPILKKEIGDFPIGTKFSSAAILQKPEKGIGILELYDENGGQTGKPCYACKLHYLVGEKYGLD